MSAEGSYARLAMLSKALDLVRHLEANPMGLSVHEIVERFECSKRNAYRWIEALELAGYVRIEGRIRKPGSVGVLARAQNIGDSMTRSLLISKPESLARAVGRAHAAGRRKPSSGRTPMLHARAWALTTYTGAAVLEAKKAITWIPTGRSGPCASCGAPPRRPIALSEDLLGAFDLIVLPHNVYVQVTTQSREGGGAAAARRRKVEEAFIRKYPAMTEARPLVLVLAWRARIGFYAWRWQWESGGWGARFEVESPLLKLRRPR
jgi:IclR helix-turn-helix domain